jgi:hypothetical protein
MIPAICRCHHDVMLSCVYGFELPVQCWRGGGGVCRRPCIWTCANPGVVVQLTSKRHLLTASAVGGFSQVNVGTQQSGVLTCEYLTGLSVESWRFKERSYIFVSRLSNWSV